MVNTLKLLKDLSETYYRYSDKTFVDFNVNAVNEISKAYPVRVQALNEVSFGLHNDAITDHYKEFALCVQMCLEIPLFSVKGLNAKNKPSLNVILINEMFSSDIMQVLIQALTHKTLDVATFATYKGQLFKLLGFYKKYCEFHKRNLFFTFNFAHLMYFISRVFFK